MAGGDASPGFEPGFLPQDSAGVGDSARRQDARRAGGAACRPEIRPWIRDMMRHSRPRWRYWPTTRFRKTAASRHSRGGPMGMICGFTEIGHEDKSDTRLSDARGYCASAGRRQGRLAVILFESTRRDGSKSSRPWITTKRVTPTPSGSVRRDHATPQAPALSLLHGRRAGEHVLPRPTPAAGARHGATRSAATAEPDMGYGACSANCRICDESWRPAWPA